MLQFERVKVSPTDTPGRWRVVEDFVHHGYTVPAGFITDGASVPWPIVMFLPKMRTDYLEASILHDYLLHTQHVSQRTADDYFVRALKEGPTKPLTCFVMKCGIYLYGFIRNGFSYL